MRNRPMKADLEELKDLKEELFDIRLKLASKKKSEPWTMDDLEKALKTLKVKILKSHSWHILTE